MLTHPLEHPAAAAHPGTFHWWGAILACHTSSQGMNKQFYPEHKTENT